MGALLGDDRRIVAMPRPPVLTTGPGEDRRPDGRCWARLCAVRIVLVVPGGVDPPGGSRVIPFLVDLIERLSADHQVRVIAVGHDPQPGSWSLFGAEVVNVPVGRHDKSDIVRVVREVSALVGSGPRSSRPDIVHGWWATLPGLAATLAARRHRLPSVLSAAGGELAWLPDIGYGGGGARGTRATALTSVRLATAVTVATEWMRHHVVSSGGRVDEVVPLGADRRRWSTTLEPSISVEPHRLVHIGSLNRVKDQSMLLRAIDIARRHEPRLHLDLLGVDTLGGEHSRLIDRLGLDAHVRLHGLVPHERLPALVRGAGMHVVSSRHEAGPVAVLEAAMCGVPTVGTNVGHVADLAGLAMPAAVAVDRDADRDADRDVDRDVDGGASGLATAIVELVGDEPTRTALAERAQRWALIHDADHTARSFEAIYRRLAAVRP